MEPTPGMLALAKAVAEDDADRTNGSDDARADDEAVDLAMRAVLSNCGTGAGGFKSGNTCAAGGGEGDRKPGEQHTAKDLKAFKRRIEHEHDQREDRIKEIEASDKTPLPDWTKIDGVDVLQVPGSEHAAFPISGKKNGATFQVFNVNTREPGPQLKKAEIHNWLYRDAERQEIKGRKGFGTK